MQIFATLQAFSHWLSLFGVSCAEKPERQADFQGLLSQIVTLIIEMLESGVGVINNPSTEPMMNNSKQPLLILTGSQIPDPLGLVLVNFLQSLTFTVRTPFILTIPAVMNMMAQLHTLGARIPLTVRCLCYKALSSLIVLPFPGLRDPEQVPQLFFREVLFLKLT